ncbi:BCCT family transporter [Brevibacterium senegalense]|uniref:BCCT family transporter n=1 Tax=Brevibacterium senegalense TaxID=1033736 RepID=UPI00030DA5F2|nr:BCCT family transporter [Brevibacterium senegalense]
MDEVDDQQKRPVVERERFSGTDRSPSRRQNETADRPPISSEEMQRGRTDLAQHAGPRVDWRVFLTASLVIVALSLWAMLTPDTAQTTMKAAVDWIAENLGWFYVVTITAVILFVLWVALSKEGSVRLGPDHCWACACGARPATSSTSSRSWAPCSASRRRWGSASSC